MTRLLLLLSAALVMVVAAEIAPWPGGAGGSGPVAAGRPSDAAGRDASRRTGSDLGRWVGVILDRPLFSPNRRPAPGAPTTVAAAGVPRLSGIVMAPDEAVAIFRQAKGAKPLVVRAGELVDGWVVSTIGANGVDLRKDDARMTVTPQFDDGTAPARADLSRTVSRWVVAPPTGLLRARWSNPQLQP